MKQNHAKTRLITFVSPFMPRFVGRTAERDLGDIVIGAATPTKGGASGNSASNNIMVS